MAYDVNYYYGTEQKFLEVYIRNETSNIIKRAKVSEEKSGTTAFVEMIEPGQEKLIIIEVDPILDDYYFVFSDIEIME